MGDTSTVTDQQTNGDGDKKNKYELAKEPPEFMHCYEETLDIDRVRVALTLITMKGSFLLVINNIGAEDTVHQVDPYDMMRGFTASEVPIQGLSLALGKHNTTILDSGNSLASASLATRLSEKLNLNRPVYVANNFQLPYDYVNPDAFMSKLHLKLFQFVKSHQHQSAATATTTEQ